jgi:hypothetical protein
MTRVELENKLAANPRFKQAEPSAAVVIVGAKPTRAVDLSRYSQARRMHLKRKRVVQHLLHHPCGLDGLDPSLKPNPARP